jgi:hypothetical protein
MGSTGNAGDEAMGARDDVRPLERPTADSPPGGGGRSD